MNLDPLPLHKLRKEVVDQLLNSRTEAGLSNTQIIDQLRVLEKKIFERRLALEPLRSQKILGFELKTYFNEEKNFDPETVFEKFLARESPAEVGRDQTAKWANQIPIWSGLWGESGGKANIDIGHTPGDGTFSLYELKMGSDHPLYAVVELTTYALGYLIVRKLAGERPESNMHKARIRAHDGGLLNATAISFSVLAPADYYKKPVRGKITLSKCELETLIACTNEVLNCLAKEHLGADCLQIDFSLKAMQIEVPVQLRDKKDRDNWINILKRSKGTLRNLVLQAESAVAEGGQFM